MRITKLVMKSYGKFSNKTIEFKDGLNVVLGSNESGKSTTQNFIRQMLYGFGSKADGRDVYRSWDGGTLEGELYFSHNDTDYCIKRRAGSTKGRDSAEFFDLTRGCEMDCDISEFLGVCEDTFRKSVFVSQSKTRFSGGNEEITTRLSNLSSCGDEGAGADKARKIIEKQQTALLHKRGRGGKIAELEDEIAHKKSALALTRESRNARFAALCESEQIAKTLDALHKKRDELLKAENADKEQERFNALHNAKKAMDEKEAQLGAAKSARDALRAFESVQSSDMSAISDISALLERQKALQSSFSSRLIAFIALLLVGVSLALCGVLASQALLLPFAVLALAASIFLVASALRKRSDCDKISVKHKEALATLASYGCRDAAEFSDKLTTFTRLDSEFKNIGISLSQCREAYEKASADCGGIPDAPYREISRDRETSRNIEGEILRLTPRNEELKAQLNAEENVSAEEIEAQLRLLNEALAESHLQLSALNAALVALCRASEKMEHEFTPRLNAAASDILALVTCGAHSTLRVSGAFDANILDDCPRSAALYSEGTAEQVYFALRVALADLLFADNSMFMVLDEPFAYYDNTRQEAAEATLINLAQKRQIIVFSCKRDTEFKKSDCNYIDIDV